MLSKLPPRERQIVDVLFQSGPLTSAEVGDKLPDQISGSAVRAPPGTSRASSPFR